MCCVLNDVWTSFKKESSGNNDDIVDIITISIYWYYKKVSIIVLFSISCIIEILSILWNWYHPVHFNSAPMVLHSPLQYHQLLQRAAPRSRHQVWVNLVVWTRMTLASTFIAWIMSLPVVFCCTHCMLSEPRGLGNGKNLILFAAIVLTVIYCMQTRSDGHPQLL